MSLHVWLVCWVCLIFKIVSCMETISIILQNLLFCTGSALNISGNSSEHPVEGEVLKGERKHLSCETG